MKVLIAGLGSIAAKHIHALQVIDPQCELFAIRSSEYGKPVDNVVSVYSWEEARLNGPFDFAIISNPTSEHQKTIKELVSFNCPLFIEKPVLDSLSGAKELNSVLMSHKVFTYVACNLRFHPCIKALKTYLEEHKPVIQEVNVYCGSYLPDWRPGRNFRELYSSNAEMGGGVHLDLIHELDYLTWLMGKPDKAISYKRNDSSLKITATDYAHYVLDYKNFIATVTLNYYRRVPKRNIEILTPDNVLLVDLLTTTFSKNGEVIFTSESTMQETYIDQMRFFIAASRDKRLAMNDFSEALEILKIAL